MSPSAVSLSTIFVIVAIGVAIGFLAGVHRKMDLEQWTVGGRGFGALLIFLLMAGEVYTTFHSARVFLNQLHVQLSERDVRREQIELDKVGRHRQLRGLGVTGEDLAGLGAAPILLQQKARGALRVE